MAQTRWQDTVISMANADIARAKEAMRGMIMRPEKRQPPIRDQITAAVAQPESLPADGRARLMQKLYEKYGEQARNVLPYIVGEPDPAEGAGGLSGASQGF